MGWFNKAFIRTRRQLWGHRCVIFNPGLGCVLPPDLPVLGTFMIDNIIKAHQWCVVQEGDATMIHIACLHGQKTLRHL